MPDDVTGYCSNCEKETPTWELTVVETTEFYCPDCYIEQCDHPTTQTSPSGKKWCVKCNGVVDDNGKEQMTLDGFTV